MSRLTGCILSPSYAVRLLRSETHRDRVIGMIDKAISRLQDYFLAVEEVQLGLAQRIGDHLLPNDDGSEEERGFISLAGDPFFDLDSEAMAEEADRYLAVVRGMVPQAPVTGAGLKLIGRLLRQGNPVLATGIMSVSQLEALHEVCSTSHIQTGKNPPVYALFLQTAFSRYLSRVVKHGNARLSVEDLLEAGRLMAGRLAQICEGYEGRVQLLICFKDGEEARAAVTGPRPDRAIDEGQVRVAQRQPMDAAREERLIKALPVFERAWLRGSIGVLDFISFGPVEYIRGAWVDSTDDLLEVIRKRRHHIGRVI